MEFFDNCSVLCCVRQFCTTIRTRDTYEQFLKMNVSIGLGFVLFVRLFRFNILRVSLS